RMSSDGLGPLRYAAHMFPSDYDIATRCLIRPTDVFDINKRRITMRSIAIPVAYREECEAALDAAFALASRLGADVAGYHMKVPPMPLQAETMVMTSLWAAGGLTPAAWPMSDGKSIELLADRSRKLFYSHAEAAGYDVARSHGRP